MEGKRDEPETINVWELMLGLNDDDDGSPSSMHFPAVSTSNLMTPSAAVAAKLTADSFTLEPANARVKPQWPVKVDGPQRPVKVDGGRGRSMTYGAGDSIRDMLASPDMPNKCSPIDGSTLNSSALFGDGSSTSSLETLGDNLQRSLSFKFSLNNESKGILGHEDTLDSHHSKASTRDFSSDATGFTTSWLLSEGEAASTPSSPSLSSSVNLKKWFRAYSSTSKQRNDMKAGSKSSMHETQSKKLPPHQVTPSLVPASKVSGSKYKGNGGSPDANSDANFVSTAVNRNKIVEAAQDDRVRRYRHSFSNGNRNKQFTEERSLPTINRPSSWELEKVVVDPRVKAVLYSTNSQVDINAYEDSNAVRAILISLVGASFDEKSISQHPDYEQELKNALNMPSAVVPTVYVRGRYVAGVDNIMQLYKKGILDSLLLETLPHGLKPNGPCVCRGGKFLICPLCKGKRKLSRKGEEASSCRHCSGTGLIKCPSCLHS